MENDGWENISKKNYGTNKKNQKNQGKQNINKPLQIIFDETQQSKERKGGKEEEFEFLGYTSVKQKELEKRQLSFNIDTVIGKRAYIEWTTYGKIAWESWDESYIQFHNDLIYQITMWKRSKSTTSSLNAFPFEKGLIEEKEFVCLWKLLLFFLREHLTKHYGNIELQLCLDSIISHLQNIEYNQMLKKYYLSMIDFCREIFIFWNSLKKDENECFSTTSIHHFVSPMTKAYDVEGFNNSIPPSLSLLDNQGGNGRCQSFSEEHPFFDFGSKSSPSPSKNEILPSSPFFPSQHQQSTKKIIHSPSTDHYDVYLSKWGKKISQLSFDYILLTNVFEKMKMHIEHQRPLILIDWYSNETNPSEHKKNLIELSQNVSFTLSFKVLYESFSQSHYHS